MIKFDPNALQQVLRSKGIHVADMERVMGVSLPVIEEWLLRASLPERRLYMVIKRLKLNAQEVTRILNRLTPYPYPESYLKGTRRRSAFR